MAEGIDQVAVELVGDIAPLLKDLDEGVERAVEAGEEIGDGLAEGIKKGIQRAAEAGEIVRGLAEGLDISIDEAALKSIQDGLVEGFNAEQLTVFATALEEVNMELGDLGDTASMTVEQMLAFTEKVVELAPEGDKVKETWEALKEEMREFANEVIPQQAEELESLLVIYDHMVKEGGVTIDQMTEWKDSFEQGAVTAGFVNAEMERLIATFEQMGVAIPNALQKQRIQEYMNSLLKANRTFEQGAVEVRRYADSLLGAADSGGFFSAVSSNLAGSITGMISSVAAAGVIFATLKKGFDALVKAGREYIEFTGQLRDLSAAQRITAVTSEEVTMRFQDWHDTARALSEELGLPLSKTIATVTGALQTLGPGTELADDQIESLITTGVRFADLYGKQLPQQMETFANFIQSGYVYSLRQMGFELDKTSHQQHAMRLGLGRNLEALSDSQLEMVRYAVLMEEIQQKTEGAGEGIHTLADEMDDLARRNENVVNTVGAITAPFVVWWEKTWTRVKEGAAGTFQFISSFFILLASSIAGFGIAVVATVTAIFDAIENKSLKRLGNIAKLFDDAWSGALTQLFHEGMSAISGDLSKFSSDAGEAADAAGEFGDAITSTAEQIDAFISAAQKFSDGMDKIEARYMQAIEDIERRFRQKRLDGEQDYQRDLLELDRDAFIDRQDATRNYQIAEIRLREDFQKDIRQLESRFLLDLDDAVRDRDARKVLDLQRRFNLEKQTREEDYNLRQKRLKEDFGFELQEIERQRRLRRQMRWEDFQQEMADLDAQETIRKNEAQLRRTRAEDALLASAKSQIDKMAGVAGEEVASLIAKMDLLNEALIAEFGPDGPWVQYHSDAVATVQTAAEEIAKGEQAIVDVLAQSEGAVRQHIMFLNQAASQAQQAARSTFAINPELMVAGRYQESREAEIASSFGDRVVRSGYESAFGSRFQRGGSFIATGERNITVGERPEAVDITPMSASTGRPIAGFGGGGRRDEMEINLNVDADDRLIVEVVDQTMTEMADVIVNVSQKSSNGGRGV